MELRDRFVGELGRLTGGRFQDLSPSLLAHALCRVLDLPGAGFVMLHRLVRLPVGAAGESVPLAERLQVTLGEGPCLESAATGQVLVAGEDELRRRWPLYHRELVERTPYRSTHSFPLRRGREVFAALDLYDTAPTPSSRPPADVVAAQVVDLLASVLLGVLAGREALVGGPPTTPALARRERVFVAVGMVQEAADVADLDALALLRGHAFRTGTDLDVLAARLVEGSTSARDLLDGL